MKRSASRDLQKKEKTKKVDHANDAIPIVVAKGGELRDLVAGWEKTEQDADDWFTALKDQKCMT